MRRFIKMLCLVLVMVMMQGIFAACNTKKYTSPETMALEAYNALKTDMEKLFYVESVEHPSVGKPLSLIDKTQTPLSDLCAAVQNGSTVEADTKLTLDKVVFRGNDYLSVFGGNPISLTGAYLANNKGGNLNLSTAYMGLPITLDVAYDKKGVTVKSPFAFQKPYYLTSEAVEDVALGWPDMVFDENNDLGIAFDILNWGVENVSSDSLRHVYALLKDALPNNSVSTETVTLSDLKGKYIKEDVEAECVTLALSGRAMDKFLTDLNNNVLPDSVVKGLVVSLGDVIVDTGLLPELKNGETVYNKLCKRFKDFINKFDAESNKSSFVVKRYFVKGFSVKLDVAVSDGGEKNLDFTAWDFYKDSAREYGVKLVAAGVAYCNVVGGADESKASLTLQATAYTTGVSVGNDGLASSSTEVQSKINLGVERIREETKLKGDLDMPIQKKTAEFDFGFKGNTVTGSIALNEKNEKLAEISVSQKEEQGIIKFIADGTIYEDGAEHKVKLGVDVNSVNIKGKDVISVVCDVKIDDLLELSGSFNLSVNKASEKSPAAVDSNNVFVINGRYDVPYISKNFTPVFNGIIGNLQGGKGEQDGGEDISGDVSLDISFDESFDFDVTLDSSREDSAA